MTDRTVYGKNDFCEKMPNVSVFGIIPHWEIEEGGQSQHSRRGRRRSKQKQFMRAHVEERLITQKNVPFRISEAFGQLCTNVTFCSTGETGCVIGVLSSLANSGKSFVMANLALSLSRMIDKKVLLVDADMRCPMQHRVFGKENKFGLSNLLAGHSQETQIARHCVNDSLTLITSGTLPPNPLELLSGPNMVTLLEQWKEEFDYILIDLPPIGEVSDAMAVAKLMSGYLFVLRSGLSDVQLVREAAALMEDKQAKIFGYVLTDVADEYMERHLYYSRYSQYSQDDRYCRSAETANPPDAGERENAAASVR